MLSGIGDGDGDGNQGMCLRRKSSDSDTINRDVGRYDGAERDGDGY